MKTAKIADLKNNLSRYLDRVRRGETIRVLDRDEPVAEIIPFRPSAKDIPEHLAKLARDGKLIIGSKFGQPMPKWWYKRPLPGRGAGVLKALLEDREQGR